MVLSLGLGLGCRLVLVVTLTSDQVLLCLLSDDDRWGRGHTACRQRRGHPSGHHGWSFRYTWADVGSGGCGLVQHLTVRLSLFRNVADLRDYSHDPPAAADPGGFWDMLFSDAQ